MSKRYIYKKKKYIFLAYLIDFFGLLLYKPLSFFKKPSPETLAKKIVVVELAHIGDVLAITPALNVLRKRFPESSITVVVAPWAQDILTGNPDVDEILVYKTPWFERATKASFSFSEAINLIKLLRLRAFDMGIDLRGDIRNILFMKLGGIRKRIGYAFSGGDFLLTDVIPFDVSKRQDKHQIEHNINFISHIKEGKPYQASAPALKLSFSKEDRLYVDKVLNDNNITTGDFLIAVHAGAGTATKRWPVERFSLLIEEILRKYKVKIILVGGREERNLLKLPDLGRDLVNLTGETSIKQLAALLSRCNLFIGGDSGVMHIAASQGTPIIAIWGGQNKPSHWKPLTDTAIIIHKEVNCSPCGLTKCKSLKCLNSISVDDVLKVVERLMQSQTKYKGLVR
jgi:lipopolysaccharide heptosyltransferase II